MICRPSRLVVYVIVSCRVDFSEAIQIETISSGSWSPINLKLWILQKYPFWDSIPLKNSGWKTSFLLKWPRFRYFPGVIVVAAEPLFFWCHVLSRKKSTRSTMTKKKRMGFLVRFCHCPNETRGIRNSSQKSCCFEEVSGLFLWFETDVWVLLLT